MTRDLRTLTARDFEPFRGSAFVSDVGAFELRVVTAFAAYPGAPRAEPFSLVFVSEARLEQGTHRLGHPELGELELFLVPIGPDADGMWRYEVVFN